MFRQQGVNTLPIVIFVCTIIIILLAVFFGIYTTKAFKYETYINGVNCSFLNLNGAVKKLEDKINNSKITLKFMEGKEYTCLGTYFDIKLDNKKEIEKLLFEQKEGSSSESKKYDVPNLYSVNEKKVKNYLKSLSIFKSEMKKPKNAYLELDKNNRMVVKQEEYGNELKLEDTCNFMISELKQGKTTIDFKTITNINPKIKADDKKMNEQKDYINSILATSIKYKTKYNGTVTLDAKTMKEWIYKDDKGNYGIDIDKNVPKFIEKLADKASYQLTSTPFRATGIGKINISFGRSTYATINKDKEISRTKEQLKKGESAEFEVAYNPLPDYLNISTYVELDLSRQRVWMYVNGKQILNTPCVTGNVSGGYATPPGIFYLTYKTTDTTLEGYNSDGSEYASPVKFWMPFNGGIGFHDASWRGNFGGNIYMTNGSHGCVNLPYWAAETLYNNIDSSIPIILYQ